VIGSKNTPLYKECANILRKQILEGKWEEGDCLPSEKEFSAEFGVSRITIRQCMKLLEEEGLIIRQAGRGTFIPEKPIEQGLAGFHNFAKNTSKEGHKAGFVIENIQISLPSKHTAKALNVNENEQVYKIERIKLRDDRPLMHERIYLPRKLIPGLGLDELSQEWLSDLLAKNNIHITRVKYSIEPFLIDDYEAKKLLVHSGLLGLLIDRVSWAGDEVVMFTRSIVRTDLVKYTIETSKN